ncbi:stage II sporulation protein M [Sphingomonas hengshuiensis]|uniref:Membrane protein n=1 Tax=Sphingomonas hengshuiensis TaxID=1609977 RepID=A0A7U4JAE0_9SPHN|nr:stage II sporulation protein M [Sphingomonas hengshuiensis]AJP73200.1 membrane protein [Sphingomonas hengshuiensis]
MSVPDPTGARFRDLRQADWERLETLIARIERGRASSLSNEDLFELPVLYRGALSSLSVARETSLDADLVGYLESLAARAYFILYGVQPPLWRRIAQFFAVAWPQAIRSLGRETGVAVAMLLIGTLAAYWMVSRDPSWFYAILPSDLAGGRGPHASAAELRATLYDPGDALAVFAAFLFTHNSQMALMCFALGFAFGVPTVLLLFYNGCILGAFLAIYVPKGLGLAAAAWLSIHGTTELFAIALAGAAGLHIGMAVAFPGRAARVDAAVSAGRTAAIAMLGVVVMLSVAGVLEGVGRQMIRADGVRAAIGGAALLGWLLYFYVLPLRTDAADG